MKHFLSSALLLIACLHAGLSYAQTPNTWTQKTSFTNGRKGACGFSIGSKGYVGTGNLNGSNQNDFWEYDPATNAWTQKANFAGSVRSLATGFSIGSKGYMGLGNGSTNDFYEYDPATNAWTQKANFGGAGRSQAVGFSIGSKGYIGTGLGGTTTRYNDFYEYNPATNTWTQKATFAGSARWGAFGFAIRGKGYIGSGSDNGSFYPNDFYEYDTAANTWTQKVTFAANPRIWSGSFSIGPFGYVGGGTTNLGLSTDFWQYDPTADAWTQKATFGGTSRDEIAAFSVGNKGYFATGWAGNYNSQVWEYYPDQLLTGAISGSPLCAGTTTISVPFTTNLTTYTSTNIFTAQLSNASGSFASPTNIGTFTGTSSGSISATIPSTITSGTGYRIRVISSSPAGNGADNGSNIAINTLSAAGISIAATRTTICAGSLDTFTATPVNGGTAPSYQWKINSINAGTNSNTLIYTPTNGDAVTCTITSNSNCVTTSTSTSAAINVIVNPIVTPAVNISTAATTVCAGATVSYTATPTSGGGSTPAYQWLVNGSNAGTNSSTFSYTPANSDTITCVLSSSAPCATSATATSNSLIMTVIPTVTPSVSASANPGNVICLGTSVTFTATPVNGGTTPGFQWKKNGINVSATGATYVTTGLASLDAITCELSSAATCASPATVLSSSIVMTVNPIVTPTVTLTANPGNALCAGAGVTFTANVVNGGTAPQYQWKYNGTVVGTNSLTYTNAAPAQGDSVICTITSSAACLTTATATSNKILMTVYLLPNPVITPSGSSLLSGVSAASYQWFVDGNSISGATASWHTPAQNGNYTVTVTDSHGCSATSASFLVTSVGIAGVSASETHIALYPNPASDIVYINAPMPMDIRVLSIDGKLLITKTQSLEVDIHGLAPGIYLMELTSKDKTLRHTYRFIK